MNVTNLMTHSLKEHPEQRNFFKPIPAPEWPNFVDGIDLNGIIVPLFVSARDGVTVLDGHQRLTAARQLGLETVPVVLREFEDEADEVAFMVTVNDGRRHDSAETRANRADYFLRKYSHKSNRVVASLASVSEPTVRRRRIQLENEGQVERHERLEGSDGKSFQRSKPVASHDATLKPDDLTPDDGTDEVHKYPTELPTDDGPELPTFTPSETYAEVSKAVSVISQYSEGQLLLIASEEPQWYPVSLTTRFGYAAQLLAQAETLAKNGVTPKNDVDAFKPPKGPLN